MESTTDKASTLASMEGNTRDSGRIRKRRGRGRKPGMMGLTLKGITIKGKSMDSEPLSGMTKLIIKGSFLKMKSTEKGSIAGPTEGTTMENGFKGN